MRTAIVTLTLGRPYELAWNELCAPTWRAYAARHGYDVIAINRPLDTSPRATRRSSAWQKLLVLRPEVANGYDRIVWLDADIIINPDAPPITETVPIDKIGATDESTFPSVKENHAFWQRTALLFKDPRAAAIVRSALEPRRWHAAFGLPARHDHIVQTGVLALLWQIYSRRGSAPIHIRQCGHR